MLLARNILIYKNKLEMLAEYCIWYVFKNGEKIDLNSPFFIIEDYNRKYALYRQLGKIKIERWKQCQKFLPFGKDLPLPHIVFYE